MICSVTSFNSPVSGTGYKSHILTSPGNSVFLEHIFCFPTPCLCSCYSLHLKCTPPATLHWSLWGLSSSAYLWSILWSLPLPFPNNIPCPAFESLLKLSWSRQSPWLWDAGAFPHQVTKYSFLSLLVSLSLPLPGLPLPLDCPPSTGRCHVCLIHRVGPKCLGQCLAEKYSPNICWMNEQPMNWLVICLLLEFFFCLFIIRFLLSMISSHFSILFSFQGQCGKGWLE